MHPIVAAGFWGIEHFTPPWDVFYLPLFNLLILAYKLLFNDFALAIIVFTIVVRTILAPLFVRQIRSQKEMQRMQPLLREVQRKHKGNRQKIAEEQQALYREHGVNPAAGCLPLVLQLPLLFALYQALIRASNLVTLSASDATSQAFADLQASLPGITKIDATHFTAPISGPCTLPQFSTGTFSHFLPLNCQIIDPLHLAATINTKVSWLFGLDLALPDRTFALVVGGFGISAIALIAAGLQFVQVRMTSPRPNPDDPTAATSSTMTYLFPLMTIFWGGLFASGLILYWAIYTAFLIGHQYLIMGWGNLFPLFGWQPRWAPPPDDALPSKRRAAETPRDEPQRSREPSQPSTPSSGGAGGGRPKQRPPGQRRRRGRRR